jgi:hypothetical protein
LTGPRKVSWWKVDQRFEGLRTEQHHQFEVQREAIPLIFVPGIMGSRLRSAAAEPTSNGEYPGKGADGQSLARWEPGKAGWMATHFLYAGPRYRKQMLIGPSFNPGYLEVSNSAPAGSGFAGLMEDYRPFLEGLRSRDWGPIGKLFEFPVYGFGYNWTDSAEAAGAKLKARIEKIKDEARRVVGSCEQVILISHSMGGLVARACSELCGGRGSILGIIHGVQPVTGSGAAYWRIKAGFEGGRITSAALGNDGKDVTVMLGNSPGGLQLLPNSLHRTAAGEVAWLRVTHDGEVLDGLALPKRNPPDPYAEIYSVPAVVVPKDKSEPSRNAFWGLVDPDLLDPGASTAPPAPGSIDADTSVGQPLPWSRYEGYLATAKSFHERLRAEAHPNTFSFAGSGHPTVDVVELRAEWRATPITNYRTRGFAAQFTSAEGRDMKALLQEPQGPGDGTVPLTSAQKLNTASRPSPGDVVFDAMHQSAYEGPQAQAYTIQAIRALCLMRYREKRPKR